MTCCRSNPCFGAHDDAYRQRLLTRPSFARAVDEARPFRSFFPLGAQRKSRQSTSARSGSPRQWASRSAVSDIIGRPRSVRAVANAIGANPVAFLIPCHRVIQQSSAVGGYRWGADRKQVMQT